MRIALLSRTLFVLVWLAALAWWADRDLATAALAVCLVAVWAAPLVRDARRARPAVTSR